AQWHRGNLPGRDSWQQPLPGGEMGYVDGKLQKIDPIATQLDSFRKAYAKVKNKDSADARLLQKRIAQWEAWMKDVSVKAENYGYESFNLGDGRTRSPLEELCRWRLF